MKRKRTTLGPLMQTIRERAPGEAAVAKRRAIDRWENEGGEIPKGPAPREATRPGLTTPGDLSYAISSATPDLQISLKPRL